MKATFRLVFMLELFILTLCMNAQNEIRFNHLSLGGGPQDRAVHCIIQDSKGYLWFGTRGGLCRYDGNEVVTYMHSAADSGSLANNLIICLFEDHTHAIWAGTFYGLSRFDPIKKKFTSYYFDKWSSRVGSNYITNILEDNKGTLWVSTITGIYTTQPENPSFSLTKLFSQKSSGPLAQGICCTHSGRVFVMLDSLILYTDNYGKVFKPVSRHFLATQNLLASLYLDDQETLWLGDSRAKKIYKMDSRSFRTKEYCLDTNIVNSFDILSLGKLNDSTLMAGTAFGSGIKNGGGVFLLNTNTGKFINYFNDVSNAFSLSANSVWCVFRDKQNNVWLGTEKGPDMFNTWEWGFHWSSSSSWDLSHYGDFSVVSMCADKNGHIWLGTSTGLIEYNAGSKRFSLYVPPYPPSQVYKNNVFTIFNSNDTLFLGIRSGGFIRFDINTHLFDTTRFRNPEIQELYAKTPRSIAREKDGTYWFATFPGDVFSYNLSTHEGKHYFKRDSLFNSVHRNYIRCMNIDKYDNKWFGTYDGEFYRIPHKSDSVIWNGAKDTKNEIMGRSRINDIVCDTNGDVYIATQSDGLIVYHARNKKFEAIRNPRRPGDNLIRKIVISDHNKLWLATGSGFTSWDMTTQEFLNYSYGDKFLDVMGIAGCADQKGNIYFGGDNELLYFNPGTLAPPPSGIDPKVTAVNIMNKGYLHDLDETVSLGYKDNVISFMYSAFDFLNEKQDHFAYMLEGFDTDWNYCGNLHFANYTNLPGGHYTFRLKAQNVKGVWVEAAHPIRIYIATPYWKTTWFLIACCLMGFGLVFAFYYLRIQRKLETERLRLRLARDLHDDIGSSLSSISILSNMATKMDSSLQEETQSLFHKISESSIRTIDSMKDLVWAIHPENDRMDSLFAKMRAHAADTLEPKEIDYSFQAEEKLETIKLSMEVKKHFYLIFKEAINNLVKYSKSPSAEICIFTQNGKIETRITDKGIGFNPTRVRMGNGLKNMEQRALLLNGILYIDSQLGSGTCVRLVFPIA